MNFKKLFLAASLVSLGLVGCAASHPKQPVAVNAPPPPAAPVASASATPAVPSAPAAPPVDPLLASGDGWSFKVPDNSWEVDASGNLPDQLLAVAISEDLSARAMLFKDSDIGQITTAKFSSKVLEGATKEAHAKLIGKTKTVTINGNGWTYANTSNGRLHVELWMVVKDGNGFTFMCGTPNANSEAATVHTACGQIAETLQIK